MQANNDFRDLFAALNAEGAEYLEVGRRHLIENKKASGRLQDLADVEFLEKGPGGDRP